MWRKAVFSTVRRALDHRVTVCVQSAASGNSNRFPSVLEYDVESRESFVFESRKVGASPVDFRCKIAKEIECVAPADSGLVALGGLSVGISHAYASNLNPRNDRGQLSQSESRSNRTYRHAVRSFAYVTVHFQTKVGPAKVKQHVTYHSNNIEKKQSHSPLNDKRGVLSNLTGMVIPRY